MKISEVMMKTGLTRKAIYYYEEQGLINPEKDVDSNYRQYSKDDIDKLIKINQLRLLDFSLKEIEGIINGKIDLKQAIICQLTSIEKEIQVLDRRKSILKSLSMQNEKKIIDGLESASRMLDDEAKILEGYMIKQLNRVLPGNVGKLFAIYYSNFLNEPIDTLEKEEAWSGLINLLDTLQEVHYPTEIQTLIQDRYQHLCIEKSRKNSSNIIERILNNDDVGELIMEKTGDLEDTEEANKALQQFMINSLCPIFEEIKKHLYVLSSKFKKFDFLLSIQSQE